MKHHKRHLLIIEDDFSLVEVYSQLLGDDFHLIHHDTISGAIEFLTANNDTCALVLTDLKLLDGELQHHSEIQSLKANHGTLKFLVVSAINDAHVMGECLREWADDYLIKPFHNTELKTKVKRLAERAYGANLDPTSMTIVYSGFKSEELTATEFKLVAYLLGQHDYRSSQSEVFKNVWGQKTGMQKIHMGISRLRSKLKPLGIGISNSKDGSVKLDGI